jgi:nitroreductase
MISQPGNVLYLWKTKEGNHMTFEEMTSARYSVRKFSGQPVEDEKLRKILETAAKAPTAKNAQSARIYILKSQEAMAKAEELTPCTYGAPLVLMFAYDEKQAFVYPEQDTLNSGAEDCSILVVHVMYEAMELGLSTCWVNLFNPEKAEKTFDLPADEKVVCLMPLGYADSAARPSPKHTASKPLDEIVKIL